MKGAIRYKLSVIAVVEAEAVDGTSYREDVQVFEQVTETIDLAAIAAVLNKKVRVRRKVK